MKRLLVAVFFWLAPDVTMAKATPCLIVTLIGTHSGPQQPLNGLRKPQRPEAFSVGTGWLCRGAVADRRTPKRICRP
jgi:hypothetical protein